MSSIRLSELALDWHPDGRPFKVRGEMTLPAAKSLDAAVSAFLKTNAAELRLNIDPASLQLVHKAEIPTRVIFRYQQFVQGIPVCKSSIIVQTDHTRHIKQMDLDYIVDMRIFSEPKQKKMNPEAAYKLVLKSLETVSLRKVKPKPSLVYFPSSDGLRLAYSILILTQRPMHDWKITVDAHSGAILEKEDIIKELPDGSGSVFDPNPVVTANDNTLRQPTATVAGGCGFAGSALATIDAQLVTRALKDLTLSGGVYSLNGPYAKIVDLTTPTSVIPTESSATAFTYSSSDERMGAVNVYYHIDTIQRYIQSLGITTANNRQTQADPAVDGFSSYYSPGDKSLHLGISRPCHPDKSQEGDSIVHEYGHAIQDNQVAGWGGINPITLRNETGSMGEGFGDTLACVFFANFGNQFQRETFEDWAYVEFAAAGLRRVDGTKVYPADWVGEVHSDGEIWSAALWNIYRAIGGDSSTLSDRQAARDTLLKSVILSHHLLATNASMPDGAEAVMNTHAELDDYRGKYLIQMLNSFHDRWLLRCDAAADLYMRDDPSDSGAEPYTGSTFWESPDLWVRNSDDGATVYQEPEFGQDNFFYARVTNRGTAAARAFVVTFNVKPWAGIQFIYPDDFIPPISAAVGFNLAAGASTIVKAKWPATLVPPAGTHACLLGQVYMPTDTTASGAHVWDKNNLAQKNMTIVDAIHGDTVRARFQLGNIHERRPQLASLEIVRPHRGTNIGISVVAQTPFETRKLFNSNLHHKPKQAAAIAPQGSRLRFREFASVEVVGNGPASAPLMVNLAPGSSIDYGASPAAETSGRPFETTARLLDNATDGVEIEFDKGRTARFPVYILPGTQLKCVLKITVPHDAPVGESLKFHLIQRNTGGNVVGGITILINVKA